MTTASALFVRRELTGSLRARWFVAYAAVFLTAGVLLATVGAGDAVVAGYRGYAKAFAGMAHLALLFVPLMALFPAVASIADERESGALEYLLAQPVTASEVYLGKWAGVSSAVALALTVGFGLAAGVAVLRGVPPGLIAALYGYVVLLALAFVALGLWFTTLTSSRARAATTGIILWLFLVALGTLGMMVAFVQWGVPERVLTIWAFANPVEAFRLGVIAALDPDLSLLGPVGVSVADSLGVGGIMMAAALSLGAWIVGPGLAGWWVFSRASR